MYFKYFLTIIFNPKYWLMNNSFDSKWNKELNLLMNKYIFTHSDGYRVKLGETIIWIENHPYASFIKQGSSLMGVSGRPSRITIIKAMNKLKMDSLSLEEKRDLKLKKLLK